MAVAQADTGPEEQALVRRARHDPDAFAELYRRYVGQIHAFAHRRMGDRHMAEDITAATFERALRHLGSFDARKDGFRPWLYRIAANQITDHYRRQARRQSTRAVAAAHVLLGHDQEWGFDAVDERIDSAATGVLDALGGLSPRYQEALSLRFLSGLSFEEAASAMGCSKPTMSVLVHRALNALRQVLDGDKGGFP